MKKKGKKKLEKGEKILPSPPARSPINAINGHVPMRVVLTGLRDACDRGA